MNWKPNLRKLKYILFKKVYNKITPRQLGNQGFIFKVENCAFLKKRKRS